MPSIPIASRQTPFKTSDIAAGAVTFTRLAPSLQDQLDELEDALIALSNPAPCSNQTLGGTWQAYFGFADPRVGYGSLGTLPIQCFQFRSDRVRFRLRR